MFSGIKSDFLKFCWILGGKYQFAMIHSILEMKFLWHHISKSRKANNLKFRMFTSIVCNIIGTKYQINPLPVTFFGSGHKAPPPVAGELPNCRRSFHLVRFVIYEYMCPSCYSAETKEIFYKSGDFEEVLSEQSCCMSRLLLFGHQHFPS